MSTKTDVGRGPDQNRDSRYRALDFLSFLIISVFNLQRKDNGFIR